MLFKHEGEGCGFLLVIGLILAVAFVVVYVLAILMGVIIYAGAIGGTCYGGGCAIKNYFLSFKENVIDSNC